MLNTTVLFKLCGFSLPEDQIFIPEVIRDTLFISHKSYWTKGITIKINNRYVTSLYSKLGRSTQINHPSVTERIHMKQKLDSEHVL